MRWTRGEQWYKMTVARSYFIACYTRSRNRSTVGVRVITNYMNGRDRVATVIVHSSLPVATTIFGGREPNA